MMYIPTYSIQCSSFAKIQLQQLLQKLNIYHKKGTPSTKTLCKINSKVLALWLLFLKIHFICIYNEIDCYESLTLEFWRVFPHDHWSLSRDARRPLTYLNYIQLFQITRCALDAQLLKYLLKYVYDGPWLLIWSNTFVRSSNSFRALPIICSSSDFFVVRWPTTATPKELTSQDKNFTPKEIILLQKK